MDREASSNDYKDPSICYCYIIKIIVIIIITITIIIIIIIGGKMSWPFRSQLALPTRSRVCACALRAPSCGAADLLQRAHGHL